MTSYRVQSVRRKFCIEKRFRKTHGCAIHDADCEGEDGDTGRDLPLLEARKLVLDDADDDVAEGDGGADTQDEEHQEEEYGEELRHHLELRQGLRIRHEGQARSATHDAADVVATDLVSEVAQNPEDRRGRYQAGAEVQARHNHAISAMVPLIAMVLASLVKFVLFIARKQFFNFQRSVFKFYPNFTRVSVFKSHLNFEILKFLFQLNI